jgi:hypothetical protein
MFLQSTVHLFLSTCYYYLLMVSTCDTTNLKHILKNNTLIYEQALKLSSKFFSHLPSIQKVCKFYISVGLQCDSHTLVFHFQLCCDNLFPPDLQHQHNNVIAIAGKPLKFLCSLKLYSTFLQMTITIIITLSLAWHFPDCKLYHRGIKG